MNKQQLFSNMDETKQKNHYIEQNAKLPILGLPERKQMWHYTLQRKSITCKATVTYI
jgi:hypothetical protein